MLSPRTRPYEEYSPLAPPSNQAVGRVTRPAPQLTGATFACANTRSATSRTGCHRGKFARHENWRESPVNGRRCQRGKELSRQARRPWPRRIVCSRGSNGPELFFSYPVSAGAVRVQARPTVMSVLRASMSVARLFSITTPRASLWPRRHTRDAAGHPARWRRVCCSGLGSELRRRDQAQGWGYAFVFAVRGWQYQPEWDPGSVLLCRINTRDVLGYPLTAPWRYQTRLGRKVLVRAHKGIVGCALDAICLKFWAQSSNSPWRNEKYLSRRSCKGVHFLFHSIRSARLDRKSHFAQSFRYKLADSDILYHKRGDDRVHRTPWGAPLAKQITDTTPNEVSQAAPPQPRKPEIAPLGKPQKRKNDVFVSAPRDVVGALSHDNSQQDSYRIEAGRRLLEHQRRCAHAVHGFCGCAAPSRTLELRMLREDQCPLGRKGGVIIEGDADVTGGLGHGIDVDVEDEVTRYGYDESVGSECVVELGVENTQRRKQRVARRACADSQRQKLLVTLKWSQKGFHSASGHKKQREGAQDGGAYDAERSKRAHIRLVGHSNTPQKTRRYLSPSQIDRYSEKGEPGEGLPRNQMKICQEQFKCGPASDSRACSTMAVEKGCCLFFSVSGTCVLQTTIKLTNYLSIRSFKLQGLVISTSWLICAGCRPSSCHFAYIPSTPIAATSQAKALGVNYVFRGPT
ncbi:hypothetical protein EDB86DRAFT_2831110 [Lactarius hatsudake]|nr:hypothetical protein EDB86DRAFT_2831110 [Lactarius hatsudake]